MTSSASAVPAATNACTVELRNIRKTYDHFVAVDSLSLRIQPGTVHGLLGPNGAGKTSTLRMLIGIIVPDAGEIRVSASLCAAPTTSVWAIFPRSAASTAK